MTPSLEIGNGNWAVKSDSLLGYKTINGKYYPREMSVVRATTGTRVNAAGLVELVPYNLVEYSEQFDNGYWNKIRATITANTTTAPNGTLTADSLMETSTTAFDHYMLVSTLPNLSNSHTYSIYLKQNGRRYAQLATVTTQGVFRPIFDLQDGVYVSNDGNNTGATTLIESVGDGWYRCSVILPSNTTNFTQVTVILQNSATYQSYLGDPTKGVYVWGAQLNEGALNTYLPTTTRLNIARIDYSTGEAALLVEPQRTNYLSDSRIDTWVNLAGSTPTTMLGLGANTVENNSGVVSSASFAGNIRLIGNQVSLSVVSGNVVTYSFYARKENTDGNVVDFWLFGNAPNAVRFQPRFNFETNTLIQLQTPTNITNTNIRSTNVGNDIYLIEATFEATASTTLTANHITTYNIGGITTFGHPQVELGASATSPIVSTGTILTRNADQVSKTGIPDLIGQTEGTMFAEVDIQKWNAGDRILGISDGSSANSIVLQKGTASNTLRLISRFLNVLQVSIQSTTISGSTFKLAAGYKNNDFVLYVNGVQINTITSASVPACSNVYLGKIETPTLSSFLDGQIKSAALYKERLSNSELATLTTL
jgi:hypothetical protein